MAAPACRAASPPCPPAQAATEEHFIAADCPACWSETLAGANPAAAAGWRFDWIVPAGGDAALSAAALSDAAERSARLGWRLPAGTQRQLTRPADAGGRSAPRLTVESGLPWSGYLGLQMRLRLPAGGALPTGSSGWLALVELLPAGTDGSPVERALVRSVAGPLPLASLRPGGAIDHLHALRWPESAKVERLQGRGWIEAPDGRLLAVAADRCR